MAALSGPNTSSVSSPKVPSSTTSPLRPSADIVPSNPDFAWAIAFGIVFQYFSIAPMADEYGPKIVYRALKADILSLVFFEIGLFGWMAIFQVAIFHWKLEMNTVTYWWMMQIGMFCGHWTAIPINYWLIKTNIKEPCA